MTKPPWTTVPMLENSRPHIEAAKISYDYLASVKA